MANDVKADVDQLYAVDLSDFTAARNDIVRRLREEGDADRAAEVAALRKPSVPVWVVNQLARNNRRDIDLLLDASHRMRAATAERDSEKAREGLDRARKAEQQAMSALRNAAERVLANRGGASSTMIDRVLETLQNAARSDDGRELLASGRLTEEIEPAGFTLVEQLTPAAPGGSRTRRETRLSKSELVNARAALTEAKAHKRLADQAVRESARRKEDAERALDGAAATLEQAEAEAAEAEAAVDYAEATVDRLRRRR